MQVELDSGPTRLNEAGGGLGWRRTSSDDGEEERLSRDPEAVSGELGVARD